MALPRRGSRAIGVAGIEYRWTVKPFFGGMRVTVQRAEWGGQRLVVELPFASYYVHRDEYVWECKPWLERCDGVSPLPPVYREIGNGWVRIQHDRITPALAERLIVVAHGLGWNPASPLNCPCSVRLKDGSFERAESITPAYPSHRYEALKRVLLKALFAVGRDSGWRQRLQEASARNPVELPGPWHLPVDAGRQPDPAEIAVPLRAWNCQEDPEDGRYFCLAVGADLDRPLTMHAMLDTAGLLEWRRTGNLA